MGTHHIWGKQGFLNPPKWPKTAPFWPLWAHPSLGPDPSDLEDPNRTEIVNFGPL